VEAVFGAERAGVVRNLGHRRLGIVALVGLGWSCTSGRIAGSLASSLCPLGGGSGCLVVESSRPPSVSAWWHRGVIDRDKRSGTAASKKSELLLSHGSDWLRQSGISITPLLR